MKLPRPPIPVSLRIRVAQRQLRRFGASEALLTRADGERQEVYLDRLLGGLSMYLGALFEKLHLDHDPALCNRKLYFRKGKPVYMPSANNPNFLIYRTDADHDIKTRVRGDGAQLSDLALRRKNKRIEKRKQGCPKRKIPSRPFPSSNRLKKSSAKSRYVTTSTHE